MSYVTSVTIAVDYASREFEAAVTAESTFGREEVFKTHLRELDIGAGGGTKFSGHSVFAGGLNYADRESLVEWIRQLPWSDLTHGVALIDSEGSYPQVLVFGVVPEVTPEAKRAQTW